QGEDGGASRFSGADAGRSVFHDNAIGGGDTEGGGALQIGLRIGLTAGDVVGGDQVFGLGEATCADADVGERTGTGGDDSPVVDWEGPQQVDGAGQSDYVRDVFYLPLLHLAVFGIVIGVGKEFTEGGDARPTVGLADDGVRVEAVDASEAGP